MRHNNTTVGIEIQTDVNILIVFLPNIYFILPPQKKKKNLTVLLYTITLDLAAPYKAEYYGASQAHFPSQR